LEGGPPRFSPRFTGADLLRNSSSSPSNFAYGTIALFGARFHALQLSLGFCNCCQADHDLDELPYNPVHATHGRLHIHGLG
jgi:hypothetical protein